MTTHHEQHLGQIPKTVEELFIFPEGFEPTEPPVIDRILHAGRDDGPIGMVLSAMGEVRLITNDDEEGTQNAEELQAILDDENTPATPERRELLRTATERRVVASFVLRIAEDIYAGPDFTTSEEGGKAHIDTDKIGDLYEDTEEFETTSPVLGLLQDIKSSKETSQIDEHTRVRAERLVRIALSGKVDQTLEYLSAAANQQAESQETL